jgi:hypothetical protein
MERLISYARKEWLEVVFGRVLSEHVTMLQMCRELGFSVASDPDEPVLCLVELILSWVQQCPSGSQSHSNTLLQFVTRPA